MLDVTAFLRLGAWAWIDSNWGCVSRWVWCESGVPGKGRKRHTSMRQCSHTLDRCPYVDAQQTTQRKDVQERMCKRWRCSEEIFQFCCALMEVATRWGGISQVASTFLRHPSSQSSKDLKRLHGEGSTWSLVIKWETWRRISSLANSLLHEIGMFRVPDVLRSDTP